VKLFTVATEWHPNIEDILSSHKVEGKRARTSSGQEAMRADAPLMGHQTLVAWAMRKFKRFKAHKIRAGRSFERLAKECPDLFAHWKVGMSGVFC